MQQSGLAFPKLSFDQVKVIPDASPMAALTVWVFSREDAALPVPADMNATEYRLSGR